MGNTNPWVGCSNSNILISIWYYSFIKCHCWEKPGEWYEGDICALESTMILGLPWWSSG